MNWDPAFQPHLLQPNEFVNHKQSPGISNSFVSIREQRKKDEEFINSFMLNIQKEKCNLKSSQVKISEGKAVLKDLIKQTMEIKNNILSLNVTDAGFSLKSNIFEKELNKLNSKIMEFESGMKNPLLKAVKRRLKKRKAIRKKKLKLKEFKEAKWKKIKEKHIMIDKLLLEKGEEVESIKREAAFKCQADSVLLEVRRKKNEAKKMLNLLPALAKLRELRSKEEEKIGGYVSKTLSEAFNQVIGRFQNLWEKQLEVYKLEEKGLKIMLEENAVPYKKPQALETNLLQWEKALFGDVTSNENGKILTMADVDIQSLIEVRKDWDQFLATEMTLMASNIPLGWVLPTETENEDWSAFLPCKKTSLQ